MTKRRKIIFFSVLGVIVVVLAFPLYRYYSNIKIGEELRKEVDAWLVSIPQIPESENGALIVNKGVEQLEYLYDVFPEGWNGCIESEVSAATLRDYILRNKEGIELLGKGLSYRKWAFTTDYEKGLELTIPNMLNLKNAANLYSCKGDLARLEGRHSDSLEDYINTIKLSQTLSQDTILITKMIYFGMSTIGLYRLLNIDMEEQLSPQDWSNALAALLDVHRAQGKYSAVYDTEYHCFAMFLSDWLTGKTEGSMYLPGMGGFRTEVGSLLASSRFIYCFHEDVNIFRKWRDIGESADPANYYQLPQTLKDGNALCAEIGLPQDDSWNAVIAQVAIPNLTESLKMAVEHETIFRGTIVLVAVRLFEASNGLLPVSLEQLNELVPKEVLIDPFSGKSLIYRREGDSFYLYSVGYNGVNDKCKNSMLVFEGTDRETVPDIVFHIPGSSNK
jgi:hypothetical protein